MLENIIYAESAPISVGDYDKDNISDLMVKFDRTEVEDILDPNEEQYLTVTMNLVYGSTLRSQARIRVI